MINKINQFFSSIQQNRIELYTEFGLQHELAIFLRLNFSDLKVKLEYPTKNILNPLPILLKKEIDIFITDSFGKRFVIELKVPKENCGVPFEMYRAIEDVKFLEQLKQNNLDNCYSILVSNNEAFWKSKRAKAPIYNFFNSEQVNISSLELAHLPNFLQKNGPIILDKKYHGIWENCIDINNASWKYYILEI